MPNIKSAEKRVELARKRTARNAAIKSATRTAVKKFETAFGQHDAPATAASFKKAAIALDKAVSKGVLHKNTAARKKSRLAKKANKLAQA
ncbi:MAG: 30S ribosomal protein S20 [Peptococcaceae bacterium]|nr:30S ribosomal protein S20 [Peptococcaceae bacterium]